MKRFLARVLATALGVMVGLFFLWTLVIGAASSDVAPAIPDEAVLVWNLHAPITERGLLPGIQELIQGTSSAMPLQEVVEVLRVAAEDDRIKGIFLEGTASGIPGWAGLRELQSALVGFREAGKPILALFPFAGEMEMALAAASTKTWLEPFGSVEVNGFSAQRMYWAKGLDKLGIVVNPIRVGKYKSAMEPFFRDSMSPEAREQTLGYLKDMYDVFVEDAEAAGGFPAGALAQVLAEGGVVGAERATELGLIEGEAWSEDMRQELMALAVDDEEPVTVSLGDYLSAWRGESEVEEAESRVGVVFVEGLILDAEDDSQASGRLIAARLREARLEESVGAVVLRVNSPGGSATASELVLREVQLLREAGKPVVASMGNVAASGGYYVSCAANEILAHPNTITGSIGVTGMIPDVSGLTDKLGIRSETVNTAPSADIGSPFRSPTDTELATIQSMVDRVYEVFLDRVAEGRGMTRDEVHEIAQGRVWSGRDAKENGLVDGFGNFEDALDRAASLANLEDGWTVSIFDAEPDALDLLLAALVAEGVTLPRSRGVLARLLEQVDALPEIPTRARVMMRMPWDLVIR